jgi:hypothetical protein
MTFRIALFLLFAFGAFLALPTRSGTAQVVVKPATPAVTWTISGALSEACTCNVPCTCNFGQGPSPHHYCYAFFSYHIRQGTFGSVKLDDLHFGAADLKTKRTFFIDERANADQRDAIKQIIARVIQKVTVAESSKTVREITPDIRYVTVKQTYDDRRNRLEVAGLGEFAADYIMGLDKSKPVIVHNNTTWRLPDTIKAKTSIFRVRAGADAINTNGTNSNQGDFTYTDLTDFGSGAAWSCGAEMNSSSGTKNADPPRVGCGDSPFFMQKGTQ